MKILAPSVRSRITAVAIAFVVASVGLSFFTLGPFHSLLTSRPSPLQAPRLLTIVAFGMIISWSLRDTYRPARRTTVAILGSLVLSDFALVAAYFIAQLH